jgi:hypothetical protein
MISQALSTLNDVILAFNASYMWKKELVSPNILESTVVKMTKIIK